MVPKDEIVYQMGSTNKIVELYDQSLTTVQEVTMYLLLTFVLKPLHRRRGKACPVVFQ